jgi:large subunit ribosomal protein L16
MLLPKRTKFRKMQKGRNRGNASAGVRVSHGEFGLKSIRLGNITSRQIEAARKVLTRYVKRSGKLWIKIFPDKPMTKKPLEVRQGKGKGSVEYWVAQVRPGTVLFELEGVPKDTAKEAFRLAGDKLPVLTAFVERTVMG